MEVDSEKDCAIVYGVVGHMEFRCDGVCSESVLGDFPETIVGNCVLLHPPPLQGSVVSALLMIMSERG